MRILAFAIAALLTATCHAQSVRYTGSAVGHDPDNSVNLMTLSGDYSGPLSFAIQPGDWSVDLVTDGQSVTFNEFTFSHYENHQINPFVSIEFTLAASLDAPLTRDINPRNTTVFEVQPFDLFDSVAISGTYRGLNIEQQFAGELTRWHNSPEARNTKIEFADWPNSLQWQLTQDSNVFLWQQIFKAPPFEIGLEPFLSVDQVKLYPPQVFNLTPFVEASSPDANNDGHVMGDDLLLLQRQGQPLDLWQTEYATPSVSAAAFGAVPEPTTATLLAMGVLLAVVSPRARARSC